MRHSKSGADLTIEPPTGTVTLMFTDIVGSTALRDALVATHGEHDGDEQYRERFLEPHNARIRALLTTHRGFEVKTAGDSFMVAFASPEDAVVCAVDIQRSLRDAPIVMDDGKPLAVRIGMHTGAATYVERDGKPDYDGHAVNIAARVESLLKGGDRIYCSAATSALAKTRPGIRFHSYGLYLLKGLSERVEIIDVLWDDAMQPAPPAQAHETLPYPWLTPWVGRGREMTALETAAARQPAGDAPRNRRCRQDPPRGRDTACARRGAAAGDRLRRAGAGSDARGFPRRRARRARVDRGGRS